MADEDKDDEVETRSGGGLIKMLIFGLVGIVVVVGANLGTLIVAKSMLPDLVYPEWMMALKPAPEELEEMPAQGPPVYTKMNPSIVVSYQTGDKVRFLQITLEAMARSEASIEAFELHAPRIRNNLLMLFASESLEFMSTTEGKEAMRQRSLEEVNAILGEESPPTRIEDIYFTAFVVQ